jgi:hypothetical protein
MLFCSAIHLLHTAKIDCRESGRELDAPNTIENEGNVHAAGAA